MGDKKLLPIAVIIMALSIVFSSFWIGDSIREGRNIQVTTQKALLTEQESADYLNLSLNEFKDILSKDSKRKAATKSYEPYEFMPYIQITNEKILFSKKELDEWIKFNTTK